MMQFAMYAETTHVHDHYVNAHMGTNLLVSFGLSCSRDSLTEGMSAGTGG